MSKTDTNTDVQSMGDYFQSTWTAYDRSGRVTVPFARTPFSRYMARTKEIRVSQTTPGFYSWNPHRPLPYNTFSYSFLQEKLAGTYYERSYVGESPTEGILHKHIRTYAPGTYPSQGSIWDYPSSGLEASNIDALDARARNACLAKVKDMKLNLGQAIGERKQTIDLLLKTVQDLVSIVKDLKKGNFIGAAHTAGLPTGKRRDRRSISRRHKPRVREGAENLAQRWLEFQYGWKPLLSDVHGAAESLAKALSESPPYGVARGMATRNYRKVLLASSESNSTGYNHQGRYLEGQYEIAYAVRFTASQLHWPTALGLTNPVELAWELLPFSFVADWFLGLGNMLSNLDATLGCTFLDGHKSVYYKVRYYSIGNRVGQWGSQFWIYNMGSSEIDYVNVTRSKLASFPGVGSPQWKEDPIDVWKIATSMALITQLFK